MRYIITLFLSTVLIGCAVNQIEETEKPSLQPKPDNSNLLSINFFSLGESAFLNNDLESAVVLFKRADEADPGNIYIKERLLETLAIASYQKEVYQNEIVKLGEQYYLNGTYTPQMLLILADAYRLQEKYQKADTFYRLTIELEPKIPVLLHYYRFRDKFIPPADMDLLKQAEELPWQQKEDILLLAELYGKIDPQKGMDILEKAYQRWDDQQMLAALLTVYDKLDKKEEIQGLIRERVDTEKPVGDPILTYLITSYYAKKDYRSVIDLKEQCFKIGSEEVLKALFFAAISLQEYETGIEAGLALEDLDAIPAELMASFYLYLSKLYFDDDQPDKAAEYIYKNGDSNSVINLISQYEFDEDTKLLKRILVLLDQYRSFSNDDQEIAYMQALVYSQIDDKVKAVAAMDEVSLQYLQENKLTLFAASIYLQNAGDVNKARDLIELEEPDSVFTTNEIMSSLLYGTDFDSLAFKLSKQELQENPKPHVATFLRYFMLAEKYDTIENMLKFGKKGLEMYPESPDLMNAVGYMIADLQIETEYDLALQLLEEAVKIVPESEMVWDSLAWLYFRLGRFEDALQAMELPLSKEIRNSEIAYHLGEIYLKLNKQAEAEKYLKLAVELADDEDSVRLAEKLMEDFF